MTAPPDDTTADTSAIIAALQTERDAALSEKAALAAALATRNSEYGERIEHQAATIDVLKAMSASPGDAQPVFDLIVRQAKELCNCVGGAFYEYDGELVHLRTNYVGDTNAATVAKYVAMFPMAPTRASFACRAILEREVVHIRDTDAELEQFAVMRGLDRKAQISVPLLRDGVAIGAIALGAQKAGGFSDSQVALLQTFAEQAVIAITSAETYRALQTRTSDLQETLEYQTATSDVLKVISRSAFDLQPVLDTVVTTAARLCNAEMASIGRREGDLYRGVAHVGFPEDFIANRYARGAMNLGNSVSGRAAREGRIIHVHDVADDPDYPKDAISIGRQRSSLGVPLLRDNEVIGVMVLARRRVEPFTDQQIELVRTFADQAVIAMENARLLSEQREALEQQTATAEVLQAINASPGDLAPVFDAMLERATTLCGASFGILWDFDGEYARAGALHQVPAAYAELCRAPFRPSPGSGPARIMRGEDTFTIADLTEYPPYQAGDALTRALVDLAGARSVIITPLRKDATTLGAITLYRQQVSPFTDKQIALLQNFAAQAVIAMENARLLTETREALEQQTATAEVLQVINASPGNLPPVFDAMLEKAMRLLGAAFGLLYTRDGDDLRFAAQRGVPAAFAELRAKQPPVVRPGSALDRLYATDRPVHVLDLMAEPDSQTDAGQPAIVVFGGARTLLMVPLRKDATSLGHIALYRQETQAFSDKQIALLENFAAQAVIAMENARLITETREALERQTATAEVLRIINENPGNLGPVFDVILEKALSLAEAAFGSLWIYHGDTMHAAATRGMTPALAEFRARNPVLAVPPVAREASETRRAVQMLDIRESESYRAGRRASRAIADLGGARTNLVVPLLKNNEGVGCIQIYRQEVRVFTPQQISLLEGFAAQAVIAMDNARLLNEIRQRQEELRVTFENMGDGVAMFDETQHLVAWNRKFQDILDVPDEAMAARPTFDEYIRYLTERGEFGPNADPDEQVLRLQAMRGQAAVFERNRPNGRIIEVRQNPVPGGGFVLIYADITERKRNEAEIRAARDAAEEASRTIEAAYRELKTAQANLIQAEKMASLGQLTAGIAHEIKNPLNFINNFSDLSVEMLGELRETAAPAFAMLPADQHAEIDEVIGTLTSNLEKITEHGRRADGIVKAMLEHSRGSSGERRMVDLNVLIDEALSLAYHGARAQDQSFNITLEHNFGGGIAPIEVNPQDITRVFLNIFSNGFYAANKRARDGGDAGFVPTLKVATRDADEAVEIRVRDNGKGIPADIRDKLFQPFFTTKPTGEGTGLGLSITYDIVTKAHGGSIVVDSKVGEYSEFTIQLPRKP